MCVQREETTEAHMAAAIEWVQNSLRGEARIDDFGVTESYNLDQIRGRWTTIMAKVTVEEYVYLW